MKIRLGIITLFFLFFCTTRQESNESKLLLANNTETVDSTLVDNSSKTNIQKDSIEILILPSYDKIHNVGGSPDVMRILEDILSNKENFKIIPFNSINWSGVTFQMIFDKRYCKPILEKVNCDIIIMSHIIAGNDDGSEPGIGEPWAYKTKIYNIKTDKQFESIKGRNLEPEEFEKDINVKAVTLINDILKIYRQN
jgi:hypothetical protein